ncbi:hypothetical protein HNQ07_004687 [Deinococcus metalli]|uniref:Uncharacterized protein n=1 Tax=Deinococcus metalli TaxID=1141878 RepID=A0A7W8KJ98_9DEIO|nr:hypothetical protein [Deinococcus metalli]MBB5379172.1 hypothetical protein [Deinococcus metalli]GHF64685.1 hypothetical protein GCM10017781_45690 [Deinococcus metalli]
MNDNNDAFTDHPTDLLEDTWLGKMGAEPDVSRAPAPADQPGTPDTSTEPHCAIPSKPTYVTLSAVLSEISNVGAHAVIQNFEGGVRSKKILAVQLIDKKIKLTLHSSDGNRHRRTIQDERIRDTPEFREWLAERCDEAKYAYRAATGKLGSTEAALDSGDDDFDRLATMRQDTHEAPAVKPKRRK